MKICDIFINNAVQDDINGNAKLLYTLVANNPRAQLHYGIVNGHGFDQYWLYAENLSTHVLLQATYNNNGTYLLSIQGLQDKFGEKNFIDYFQADEHEIFMKYLKLF